MCIVHAHMHACTPSMRKCTHTYTIHIHTHATCRSLFSPAPEFLFQSSGHNLGRNCFHLLSHLAVLPPPSPPTSKPSKVLADGQMRDQYAWFSENPAHTGHPICCCCLNDGTTEVASVCAFVALCPTDGWSRRLGYRRSEDES